MPSNNGPEFFFTDGSIQIWREHPGEPENTKTFTGVNRLLKRIGFDVRECEDTKKRFDSLSKTTRVGRFGNLQFCHRLSGRHQEIEFFQDVNFSNPNGGKYDFGKESRMPYQVKLRYLWTRKKIADYLIKKGIPQVKDYKPRTALDFIAAKRAESWHWHPGKPMVPSAGYEMSGDKKKIEEGMEVFFYDWSRRLGVGRAFYNLNNMWWIVVGSNPRPRNIANFDIFVGNNGLPRKRWSDGERKKRVEKQYESAIERRDFERAAQLRDFLGLERVAV